MTGFPDKMSDLDEWRDSFADLDDELGDDAWRGMSLRTATAPEPDCGFGSCGNPASVVVEHGEYGRRVVCEKHVGANREELFGVDPLTDDAEYDEEDYVSSHSYTQSQLPDYQGGASA